METLLNEFVYQKGGWVLHMLRDTLGPEVFFAGIRDYYRRYRDGNATTDDLRQVFEQLSHKPLQEFFAQWLNRPGVPRIEGTWHFDPTRKVVEVTVRRPRPVRRSGSPSTSASRARRTRRPSRYASSSIPRMRLVPSRCRSPRRLSRSIHPRSFWQTSATYGSASRGGAAARL